MDQKVIDHIESSYTRILSYIDRNRVVQADAIKDLLLQWKKALLNELPVNDAMIALLKLNSFYYAGDLLEDVVNNRLYQQDVPTGYWTIDNPVIQKVIHAQHLNFGQGHHNLHYFICRYISRCLSEEDIDADAFVKFLHQRNFSTELIISICCNFSRNPFYKTFHGNGRKKRREQTEVQENILSAFSEFILPLIKPQKGFLGFGKNDGVKKEIDKEVLDQQGNNNAKFYWVHFLYDHYPELLTDQYKNYLWSKDYNNKRVLDLEVVFLYLTRDAAKCEPVINEIVKEIHVPAEHQFSIYSRLNSVFPQKYDSILRELGETHFRYFSANTVKDHYFYDPHTTDGVPLTQAYTEFLWDRNPSDARKRIEQFIHDSTFLTSGYFNFIDEKLGEAVVPLLMKGLFKNQDHLPSNEYNYYSTLFNLLGKYNVHDYLDRIIEFSVTLADKKSRILACNLLGQYKEAVLPKASELLTGKTVDHRVTGALILSAIGTTDVEEILNAAVDKETNDETRDIILDTLREKRFARTYTQEEVNQMIAHAEARKKLSKWNEKWIDESKLPKLHWLTSQAPLNQQEIRFLFYRMKRAQGLNSDIEAKQVIHLIDKEKSNAFAKALLSAFQDSNADSKLKYYLTLAGLLGDDDMMHSLVALFKKSITDKRVKMAEYVIGALAMVGTNKALRNVEVIYRKFATKKPAISLAAKEALTAAGNELGITMDELADRIIPNFDFDGLYKTIQIEGDEYRAFINEDFKINFFTEDNKIRKSLPANAPKEVKAEFKEIEKEVNDVIKSQSGRLEKYMLEERRWPATAWRTFFFENPIMFVYALKLVWGVYDSTGKLINSFYCSEDTSLYDVNDDEVVIEDGDYIGIIHPIHLTAEQLTAWKDKLYNMSKSTIFPIFDRPVHLLNPEEAKLNYTKKFFGKDVPKGADFVNTFLVKLNWRKSSGDGGSSEFSKYYKDSELHAYANIEGPAAYYQGGNTPAKVFEIMFLGKNWNDKIELKDVPPIFYSEVIADIDQLINA